MIAINEALAFVRRNGNRLDQIRLDLALGKPVSLAAAEAILSSYQYPDGSWDYVPLDPANPQVGSLGGTIHCLRWVREFSLGHTPLMARSLAFLETIQAPDGSFYETATKLAHSPQRWLQDDPLTDRFYFTAAVPMRLFSLGFSEPTIIEPALQWLARHWTDWSLGTGTWYNLWALLCLSPRADRLSTTLYQRCYATALDWLAQLEIQPLTWLLDALQGAGYSRNEPLVNAGLQCIVDLQGEHGLWIAREDTVVESTVTAVRILLDYGSIQKPGL